MVYHFSSRLPVTLNLCLIYFKITWAVAIPLEHMHKKFEINRTKIKGCCQLGRKEVAPHSKRDLPLVSYSNWDCNYLIFSKLTILQAKLSGMVCLPFFDKILIYLKYLCENSICFFVIHESKFFLAHEKKTCKIESLKSASLIHLHLNFAHKKEKGR